MAKVSFAPNVPQQVALKYAQGRVVSGRWGERMVYALADGRQMCVTMDVASKINMLEINGNEPFFLCKRWNGSRAQPVRWDVWRTPQAEKARVATEIGVDETLLEKQLRESIANVRKPATFAVPKLTEGGATTVPPDSKSTLDDTANDRESMNGTEAARRVDGNLRPERCETRLSWPALLLSQTEALTDVYTAALSYSGRLYGNQVEPEDVRTMMITAFIGLSQRRGSKLI